jgi:hypothetical protein
MSRSANQDGERWPEAQLDRGERNQARRSHAARLSQLHEAAPVSAADLDRAGKDLFKAERRAGAGRAIDAQPQRLVQLSCGEGQVAARRRLRASTRRDRQAHQTREATRRQAHHHP